MICVVVLQNCMGFVERETGSCSVTHVACDVDGAEEVSIKVEAIDVKEEDSIKVEESTERKDEIPPNKTQNQVRLQGVCEVVLAHAFRPFITAKG